MEQPQIFKRAKRNASNEECEPNTNENWVTKYAPKRSLEVCINPRKMAEVKQALGSMINGLLGCRILVLSGPAGCSKSLLAQCLSRELLGPKPGQIKPSHRLSGPRAETSPFLEYHDSSLDDINQPQHFREFMDGCRYLTGLNSAVVLIEELPNIYHPETLMCFRLVLSDWIGTSSQIPLPPVVLCLTEVEVVSEDQARSFYTVDNNLTVETLLGPDLMAQGFASGTVHRIKFQKLAKTFMRKTIDKVVKAERVAVDREVLLRVYETGDIRSLLGMLEFWAGRSGAANAFRQEGVTLFHAVGKVIHASSLVDDSQEEQDHQTIVDVVERYNNSELLNLAVLENYHIYNGLNFGIDKAAAIADSLSLNDTFHRVEEANEYGIRATRCQLRKVTPTPGRTLPMKFPRNFKAIKKSTKVREDVRAYCRYLGRLRVLFADANLLDGCLLPPLKNARHKGRYLYNRIGGLFREIYADDVLPTMEGEMPVDAYDQFQDDILAARLAEQNLLDYLDDDLSDCVESDEDYGRGGGNFDDTFDDALDEQLMGLSTQALSTQAVESMSRTNTVVDDDFSDDDVDMLVSSGRL